MPRRSPRLATKGNYDNEAKSLLAIVNSKTKLERNARKHLRQTKKLKSIIAPFHGKTLETKMSSSNPRSSLLIGCHTSISGGLWKAVEEANMVSAKAFGLFLHSQQQWKMNPLAEGHAKRFKDSCKKFGYSPSQIVPHGSYLMNCGSPRPDVKEKSADMLIEELKRCEELGLEYFNFHPGSTLGKISVTECIASIADAINLAHRATKNVITLLENMSCQGNTIGGKMEELKGIIDLVEDKSRVGVCIDTCHAHAAGYDLSAEEGYNVLVEDLENVVGLQYVKAFHLNDSKGPCGCHKDRHENIGRGTIGLDGFRRLVNDERFAGIPMIIETPMNISDAEEIRLLYSLKHLSPKVKI